MTDEPANVGPAQPPAPRWRPVTAVDRRVLGVLAEKAKTTPDVYPLTLNSLVAGCNQKSNRAPLMQLDADHVQESLDRLREWGAVGLIESVGRVPKYRHYLYEWLGVEKIELSVMTELLLRGAQTEGELRGRAARMDPIDDLTALRAILVSLRAKGLVIPLTPEGRGHVLTHNLYPPRELEQLKAQYGQTAPESMAAGAPPPSAETHEAPIAPRQPAEAQSLRRELDELRSQLGELREQFDELTRRWEQTTEELRGLKDSLGG